MKKTLNKSISILLAVLMLLTAWVFVAPEKASAADRTIYNANDLKSFLSDVGNSGNSYSGKTVVLANDIDLGSEDFGNNVWGYNDSRKFQGTFDGQGHTIRNFKMIHSNHRVAMFRTTGTGATFRNLNFEGVWIDDSSDSNKKNGFAVLVGYHDSGSLLFENVHVKSGNIYGYNYVGALVGEIGANSSGNSVTLTNCSNGANINGLNVRIGGLVGSSLPAVYATNCTNTGSVTSGSTDVGGIVGWIEDDPSSFTGCTNSGEVQGKDAVGGIFGYFGNGSRDQKMTLINNTNTGDITATSTRAGGIGGHLETDNNAHEITGNVNRGTITGGDDVGGIIGRNKGYGVWTNNINYGTVTSSGDNAGGIVGEIEDDKQVFTNCYNTGAITGKNSTGGIVGWLNDAADDTFTHCYNTGTIRSTSSFAGGIAGRGNKMITCTECFNIGNVDSGGNDCGGLVGSIQYHTFFYRCFNAGNVTAPSGKSAGGLIGYTSYNGSNSSAQMVVDCFNWGTIKAGNGGAGTVGGLVGYVNNGSSAYHVANSYNTGTVSGGTNQYQFVGNGGTCDGNCYKIENSGSGTYKTAEQFETYDFSISSNFCKNTWGVRIGSTTYKYPILTWYRNMFSFESKFVDSATGTNETILKNYGESFTVPNPTRPGYSCGQWLSGNTHRLVRGSTVYAGGYSGDSGIVWETTTNYDKSAGPADTNTVVQSFSDPTEIRSTRTYGLIWHEGASANMYATTWANLVNGAPTNINEAYRAGIDYTIYNLTTGHDTRYTQMPNGSLDYESGNGIYQKSYQKNGTGDATATLEVDRSKHDDIKDTGIYIDYYPFIYTQVGGVRWGIEIFDPSDSSSKGVLNNDHWYANVTGSKGNTYRYEIRFNDVNGNDHRCAETNSDFTQEPTGQVKAERRYGSYKWYLKGPAPAVGESVTLRVTAICCARHNSGNLQKLSEWTDITITGTCSHSKGYNDTITAPTCTEGGYTTHVCKTSTCGNTYTDSSISALGHDYGTASYSWSGTSSCEGTRTCSRDGSHKDEATATITNAVTTEPSYSNDGVRTYTATFNKTGFSNQTKTESIPALNTLITVPTVVNKLDSNTGSTMFTLSTTATSQGTGVSGTIVGLASAAPSNPDVLAKSAPGTTNSINGHQGTISIDDGTISYTLNKMTFTQVEEFYAVVKVEGVLSHKYDGNSVYTYEKVTIVPSQTVLFDDEFSGITFGPNGKWTTTNSSTVNNAGDGAGQVTENEGDSVLYSLGSIHKVNVSAADAASWPTAEFTFTGTGFDLISVTSNDSGVFSYSIYEAGTNNYAVDSNGKRYAKNKLVDTYYGYTYGDLYWNAATRKIVGIGGDPLYIPNEDCPPEEKIVTGNGHYVYTTNSAYAEGGQVKGWLEATSGVNGLYQIPVISRNDLPYGTYRVVVTAMYNQNFAHNNSKSYNLYIDGVRIYNPAQGNETAQTKYNTDGESNPVYTSFRNALNDGYVIAISGGNKLYEDGADNNGIDKNTMSLEAYLKGSPNNELYLLPGGTISFDINGNAYEAIKIGAKSVDGSATTMGVAFGNGSRSFSVNTATEKYYSVKDLIDDSSGTVTITNNGSGILSLTKLMTSVKPSQSSHAPARIMSVSESTFDEALELLEMTEADIAIDEETIETTSSDDGTVTITLQTGEDAQTIVIRDADGNVVEPDSIDFTIDETGVKNWTIVLTESESVEYTFTLQAEYENGYTGETEPTTVTVTVSFPEPEDTSIGGRLDKIKGFFERLIEFIRRIINLFR